jgi:hypothetical protein
MTQAERSMQQQLADLDDRRREALIRIQAAKERLEAEKADQSPAEMHRDSPSTLLRPGPTLRREAARAAVELAERHAGKIVEEIGRIEAGLARIAASRTQVLEYERAYAAASVVDQAMTTALAAAAATIAAKMIPLREKFGAAFALWASLPPSVREVVPRPELSWTVDPAVDLGTQAARLLQRAS